MRGTRVRAAALIGAPLAALLVLGGRCAAGTAADAGRPVPEEGREHVPVGTPVTYGHHPPTSGPHWPTWTLWNVYTEEIPPEVWVHNLEHGGIVILYRCDQPCPSLVQQLRDVFATFPKTKWSHVRLVIAPDRQLRTRLAILAWGRIDEMEEFDRERLLRFYRERVDRGPEDMP
jgi:hypothetical protein